jgi:predicted site-specific integrase-resolvase
MKLSSYAKKLGIHYNTAYRLFKRGQIAGYQLPTGTVIIEEPVDLTEQRALRTQFVAVYARVSSTENKKNLDTQAERLITWCNAASADRSAKSSKNAAVASTINAPNFWHCWRIGLFIGSWWSIKTGHRALEVPLFRRSWPCKSGNWSSSILLTPLKTSLLGDFVAIITSFAARLYGRRRAKRTTAQVLAAFQQNGEDA